MSHLALQRGRNAVESHILAPISTKIMVIQHQSGWKYHVKYIYSGSVNCFTLQTGKHSFYTKIVTQTLDFPYVINRENEPTGLPDKRVYHAIIWMVTPYFSCEITKGYTHFVTVNDISP